MARASLAETQAHLKRGLRRKHLTQEEFDNAWNLAEVALKTTTGLLNAKLAQIEKDERAKQAKRSTEGAKRA